MPKTLPDHRSRRISRVKDGFARLGIDTLLVRHLPRIRYLCGFTGSSGILLLTADAFYLLVDPRYTTQAEKEAPSCRIREFRQAGKKTSWEKSVSFLLQEIRAELVGFESEYMTVAMFEGLRRQCPRKIRWTPQDDWLDSIRAVKDEDEIAILRHVADLASMACTRLVEWLKPGVVELDVAAELEYWLRQKGADKLSFEPIVASGPRSAWPHGRATRQKLPQKGWVMVDFGALRDGYSSDMTRTFHLGRPTKEDSRRYRAVQEAQSRAILSLHPGIGSDIPYLLVKKHLKRYGLDECFTHGLGHGIGLELHEKPSLSWKSRELLQSNMVMTVEPGIYIPREGGVRIEDMILLQETGAELLTDFSRDLIVL